MPLADAVVPPDIELVTTIDLRNRQFNLRGSNLAAVWFLRIIFACILVIKRKKMYLPKQYVLMSTTSRVLVIVLVVDTCVRMCFLVVEVYFFQMKYSKKIKKKKLKR